MAGLACFKQALSFDPDNTKLWIEYGSLAYWMHSMLSRKIKRGQSNEEDKEKKTKMLQLARSGFQNAPDSESDEIHD